MSITDIPDLTQIQETSTLIGSGLSIHLIQDLDEFYELESIWNDLLFKMNNVNPFLTWEWCSTWWKYFKSNHELFTFIVKENDDVVAIYPLRKTRYKNGLGIGYNAIEFLCYRSNDISLTDYNGFISYKKELTCFKLLLDRLNMINNWDVLRLFNVPEYFGIGSMINGIKIDNTIELEYGQKCPFIENNISLEERMKQIPKKFRKNIQRYMRNLKKSFDKIEVSDYTDFPSLDDAMDFFYHLHQSRWNKKQELGVFHDSLVKNFHKDIANQFAAKNRLKLYFLTIDDIHVSVSYGFLLKNIIYEYLTGFNMDYSKYSPGNLLQWMILEIYERDSEIFEIDLLRGDESYKYLWGAKDRVNINSIIVNKKWSSGILNHLA
jgi:CelD/BcsL family acetyltransferase involved in cellulose biosynthesis